MKIEIAGQDAFIVYFGDQLSASISAQIQRAVSNIHAQMSDIIIDLVPSYASLLVIFNLDNCDPFLAKSRLKIALTDLQAVDSLGLLLYVLAHRLVEKKQRE